MNFTHHCSNLHYLPPPLLRSRIFIAVCLALTLTIFPVSATTVTQADLSTRSCNANYYESLKSRATLMTRRTMTQAQNYIYKPDSVLDYSCFNSFMRTAAVENEQIFSESSGDHCFPSALDCALDEIVMPVVNSYLTNNFNHNFLGGNSGISRASYSNDLSTCTVMKDVWSIAKCVNFMTDASRDAFYSFSEYIGREPRDLPTQCPASANPDSRWNDPLQQAYNPGGSDSWLTPIRNEAVNIDQIYEKHADPVSTGIGNVCGPVIKTGIIIQDDQSTLWRTPKPDGICTNPGCTLDDSGNCVKIN